jgi:hypothetical protein
LLQFGGDSGGLNLDWNDEQWSFRTFTSTSEGFSGDPYIGLGDLNTQDAWDMEFGYVNYRDDGFSGHWVPEPTTLLLLAIGGCLVRRRR